MATRSKYNKPIQKLIYSKDNPLSISNQSTIDPTIIGLFKSSSSLSRSIRQQEPQKNSLQSSGALIINETQKKGPVYKSAVSTTNKNMLVRNIIHDYSNIDTNEITYKILNDLRTKKRNENLNLLEDYEDWKKDEVKKTEKEVKK